MLEKLKRDRAGLSKAPHLVIVSQVVEARFALFHLQHALNHIQSSPDDIDLVRTPFSDHQRGIDLAKHRFGRWLGVYVRLCRVAPLHAVAKVQSRAPVSYTSGR